MRAFTRPEGERFAQIPAPVIQSAAFKTLGRSAYLALMNLLITYNGRNNGDLSLPYSRYREYGYHSKDTMKRGIDQLVEHGLIVRTQQGGLTSTRIPHLYAIAWLPIQCKGKVKHQSPLDPPNGWATWIASEPPRQRGRSPQNTALKPRDSVVPLHRDTTVPKHRDTNAQQSRWPGTVAVPGERDTLKESSIQGETDYDRVPSRNS